MTRESRYWQKWSPGAHLSFLVASNWGTSIGPSAIGLRVVSQGTHLFQSNTDTEVLFNYRYGVDRRPTLYSPAPCCTATEKASHGELLTLKSEASQAGTQRLYPRSSLLVLPSGDSSCANTRRNIENKLCADTPLGHFPPSPALISLLPGPVSRS